MPNKILHVFANSSNLHAYQQRHQTSGKEKRISGQGAFFVMQYCINLCAILHQPSMYPGVRHGVQYCTNPPCTRGSDTVCKIARISSKLVPRAITITAFSYTYRYCKRYVIFVSHFRPSLFTRTTYPGVFFLKKKFKSFLRVALTRNFPTCKTQIQWQEFCDTSVFLRYYSTTVGHSCTGPC